MEIIAGALVCGVLLALGFCSAMWLTSRFKANSEAEKLRAYRDAYIEAQKKISEDFKKQEDTRQKFDEFPKTPAEEIQSYEQSLKNLYPEMTQDQVDKAIAAKRKM